jgi:hypothetical protein
MNTHTTIKQLLVAVFSTGSNLKLYRRTQSGEREKSGRVPWDPNDSNGKYQQQFTQTEQDLGINPRVVRQKNMVMSPAGPKTKNYCANKNQKQFT